MQIARPLAGRLRFGRPFVCVSYGTVPRCEAFTRAKQEAFMSVSTTKGRSSNSQASKNGKTSHVAKRSNGKGDTQNGGTAKRSSNKAPSWFTLFAQKTAQLAGRPSTFMLATAVIVVWGVTGPLFGYSDTWQLVINTGTTIVTFLMVFLIQHTQNRDSLAFQVKLDELIIKLEGAGNELAGAEDLCDEDLEALHKMYRKRASMAEDTLEKRRAPK
jgi:low affinity Fe/Cu permease